MLGEVLKAGVPMEVPLSGTPNIVAHKKTGIFSRLLVWKSKYQKRTGKRTKQISEKQYESNRSTVDSSPLPSETSVASSQVSKTPISDSSSKQELVQLVERSQGSKHFLFLSSNGFTSLIVVDSLSFMRSSQHSLEMPQPPSLS